MNDDNPELQAEIFRVLRNYYGSGGRALMEHVNSQFPDVSPEELKRAVDALAAMVTKEDL